LVGIALLVGMALLVGAVVAPVVAPGVASAAHGRVRAANSTATGGPQPAVPATGAYLGIWLDPGITTTPTAIETTANLLRSVQQFPAFDATLGRPLGFVHLYQRGNLNKFAPVTNGMLRAVAATGAIPLIDWPCALPDSSIIQGAMDTSITKFAQQLARYSGPVFLRWSWEMNLKNLPINVACQGTLGATGYIQAFQHIRAIFAQYATNVAFVWCPSAAPAAATPHSYYPGNSTGATTVVNWIGFDGYNRTVAPSTSIGQWQTFYSKFSGFGKPMMVAETGAPASSPNTTQASFLAAVEQALPSMPEVKAVGYYDSKTKANNWTLNAAGRTQYIALASDPYFSAVSP